MAARITGDVLESYVSCKYKGYLKLIGQQDVTSDTDNLPIHLDTVDEQTNHL